MARTFVRSHLRKRKKIKGHFRRYEPGKNYGKKYKLPHKRGIVKKVASIKVFRTIYRKNKLTGRFKGRINVPGKGDMTGIQLDERARRVMGRTPTPANYKIDSKYKKYIFVNFPGKKPQLMVWDPHLQDYVFKDIERTKDYLKKKRESEIESRRDYEW